MKRISICMAIMCFAFASSAQLKTTTKCPDFTIDILDGTVNKTILPISTVGQIKLNLPCFTSFEEEGTTAKCGAGVFYKDKDISFYTTRDYIEIGPNFKGAMSLPLIGAQRDALFKWLGTPGIKEKDWEAFQTAYGILILYYNDQNKVNKIQFSNKTASTIQLCE